MNFRDLIDTAQAIALSETLSPSETSVWERYCREFSTRFSTPLMEVRNMDPLFVLKEVNADNLSDLNIEERLPDIFDMLGSLNDPNWDSAKEKAIRDEMRMIEERETERLKNNEPIHESLVKNKDKRVIVKDEHHKSKELPKQGGINMGLINRLNNQDKEG